MGHHGLVSAQFVYIGRYLVVGSGGQRNSVFGYVVLTSPTADDPKVFYLARPRSISSGGGGGGDADLVMSLKVAPVLARILEADARSCPS